MINRKMMTGIKNKLLLMVSMWVLLLACEKDYEADNATVFLLSDVKSLVFKQEGETQLISLSGMGNSGWSIDESSYAAWITAVKEGKKIRVTAEKNEAGQERSTQLTIVAPEGKKTFTISQFGTDPVLKIAGNQTEFFFKKEEANEVIQIISNTDNWKVEFFEPVPWLSCATDTKKQTLTLQVNAFKKEDPGSTANRRAMLFVSSGDQHIQLKVTQNGWAQFGSIVFTPDLTRQEIIALEEQRGHQRDLEYDKLFYPRGEAGDKEFMGFNTDGEQTALLVYQFDFDRPQVFKNQVFLKAHKNQTFKEEDLKAWMEYNRFEEGRKNPRKPTLTKYYNEGEEKTAAYEVYNAADAKINYKAFDYPGAYMKYVESSNFIEIDRENEQLKSFPVRNSCRLNDASYQLKEVIAYEKKHGMVPDYDHPLTKKINHPQAEYAYLVFKQEVPNTNPGQLIHVIYWFNYPEASDENGNLPPGLSRDPALAGTVGSRQDVYQGNDYVYNVKLAYPEFPDWGSEYDLKRATTYAAAQKGYDFVRSDSNGYATYVRGKKDLVDLEPTSNWVKFTFYQSEELVGQVQGW